MIIKASPLSPYPVERGRLADKKRAKMDVFTLLGFEITKLRRNNRAIKHYVIVLIIS
jgi:hypothetical protein